MINLFEKKLLELDEVQNERIKKWEVCYKLMSQNYCERILEELLGRNYHYPEQPEKVAALRRVLWQDR